MRGRLLRISALARAAACAAVAAAIAATALHVRHSGTNAPVTPHAPARQSDPLAAELAHCQAIGTAAKDDADCEAAWAENRRRFFTYGPASIPEGR